MTPKEYEDYLVSLTNDQYDALIQERIARLDPEGQKVVQAREVQRKYRHSLMVKASDPNSTDEDHEAVYNALREGTDFCEHERPYCKHCLDCGEIDHVMFPELFDKYGIPLDESEVEDE